MHNSFPVKPVSKRKKYHYLEILYDHTYSFALFIYLYSIIYFTLYLYLFISINIFIHFSVYLFIYFSLSFHFSETCIILWNMYLFFHSPRCFTNTCMLLFISFFVFFFFHSYTTVYYTMSTMSDQVTTEVTVPRLFAKRVHTD